MRKIDGEKLKKILEKEPDKPYIDIAKELGFTHQAIAMKAQKLGFPRRRAKATTLTDEEIVSAILASPEKKYKEIAKELGINHCIVSSRAKRAGISKKVDHEARRKLIADFWKNNPNISYEDIALETGIGSSYVGKIMRDIKGFTKPRQIIDMDKLKQLLEENPRMSLQKLADTFGCTTFAISAAKQRMRDTKEKPPRKKSNKVKWEEIEKVMRNHPDWTVVKIAREVDVAPTTMSKILHRHNMLRGHKRKIDYDKLKEQLKEGKKTLKELAKEHGVTINGIYMAKRRIER